MLELSIEQYILSKYEQSVNSFFQEEIKPMLWRVTKPFVFLALLVALVGTACVFGSSSNSTKEPTNVTQEVEQPVTEQPTGEAVNTLDGVQTATIQIEAQGTSVDPQQGTQLNAGWTGTGFFISPDGLAVTNNHVVTGAAILKVYVGGDSTPYNARIVAVSECADLAVIKVSGGDFPYLEWYDGDVKVGMEVYAAGFPLSEPEYNLTKGIVSKAKADGQTFWSSIDYVISHDATINPGNSGGPLVTSEGKVVGVNYRSRPDYNQYFAIGADIAGPIVKELEQGNNVNSIGINGEAFSFGPNNEYPGIWAYSVESGSVADKAGIKAGDIVLEIENILLATDGTYKDYCDILRGKDLDSTMAVRVYRPSTDEILEGQLNGRELEVTGYGGLSNGSASTTTSSGGTSTSSSNGISTEFDGDIWSEGWYSYYKEDDSLFTIENKPGRVIIYNKKPGIYTYLFNDAFSGSDVKVTTYATKIDGPNRMNTSVVCRATDKGWYEFSISSGGLWWIWKWDPNAGDNGYYYQIAKGTSTKIGLQKQPNLIEATCIGTTLTLYVNGYKIGEGEDRDFTDGVTGFALSSLDLGNAEVEYEYFTAEPQ